MRVRSRCEESVWGDCYCVIIYNTPSLLFVLHTHRCRTVKGWEWASVGASYINQQACGVCGVRTLDCYFLWARISLLLVKTEGVQTGGVKTQPSFLPWSKEQRVQRRNYTWGSQYGNEASVVLCALTSTADSKRRDICFWCIFSTLTVSWREGYLLPT